MQDKKTEETKHELHLVSGQSLLITNVKSVPSFDSNEVEVVLFSDKMKICGDNMEIDKLDTIEHTLSLTGNVRSIMYNKTGFKKSLAKRLFK